MRALLRYLCLLMLTLSMVATPAWATVRQLGADSGVAVGVLYPGTGSLSAVGASSEVAFGTAITDLNAYLSQQGYSQGIKLLLYDTGSSADGALTGLKELQSLGVKMVIGPYTSSEAESLLPYADANDILLISPSATAPSLEVAGDNLLRLSLDDTYQAMAIAGLMWQEGKRAYLPVWRGDTYGDQLESLVARQFASLGGKVLDGVRYDPGSLDDASVLSQLDTLVAQAVGSYGAGGVAVDMFSFEEGIGLLAGASGYESLGQVKWYGSDGTARSQALLNNSQAAAFAARTSFCSPSQYESVETSTTPRLVLDDIALRNEISYKLGGSTSPGTYESWDAVWLAGLGYAASGFSGGGSQLRRAVMDQANSYVGLSGVLTLDAAGDRVYGNYGFFTVDQSGSSYAWKISASYASAYGSADGIKFVSPWEPANLSSAPATYQVGVLLNGDSSTQTASDSILAGLEEAVQAINIQFALYGSGTRVQLVTYDTGGDVYKAMDDLRSLASQGVKTIIGPITSAEATSLLPVAQELGQVLISPGSDASSLSLAGDNLYRMVPDLQTQGQALAKLMWQQGRRAMVNLYRDDIWGQQLAQATAQAFEQLGGVVLDQVTYSASGSDYGQALAAVQQDLANAGGRYSREQLAVQLSSWEEGVGILGQTAGYSGLSNAYWYGSESLTDSSALVGSGTAAQFAAATNLTTVQYALEIPGLVNGIPKSLPLAATMTRINALMGSKAQSYAATAWDGLWMAVLAAENSNWSSSASTLGQQLLTTSTGYIGLSNALALNANGDRRYGNYDFLTPSSGSWRTIYTYYTNPATGQAQLVSR